MKKQLGYTATELIVVMWAVVILAGVGGWVWNIVKIVQSDMIFTGMLVVRIIGIFIAPLGAIVGYF